MGKILPFERPEELPCPACGRAMPRERIRCRHCRASLLPEAPRRPVPGWIWLGLLLGLAAAGWMLRPG